MHTLDMCVCCRYISLPIYMQSVCIRLKKFRERDKDIVKRHRDQHVLLSEDRLGGNTEDSKLCAE